MKLFVGTEKTSTKEISKRSPKRRVKGSLTVQLFQGKLLGFSDETEDHEPSDEIQPRIETDWTSSAFRLEKIQESTYKPQSLS